MSEPEASQTDAILLTAAEKLKDCGLSTPVEVAHSMVAFAIGYIQFETTDEDIVGALELMIEEINTALAEEKDFMLKRRANA
jgi:hypothetical protein